VTSSSPPYSAISPSQLLPSNTLAHAPDARGGALRGYGGAHADASYAAAGHWWHEYAHDDAKAAQLPSRR
jgi:hypothetical protein